VRSCGISGGRSGARDGYESSDANLLGGQRSDAHPVRSSIDYSKPPEDLPVELAA
jgi:hypothetical protein